MSITSSIVNREIDKMNEQLESKMMLRVQNNQAFNQSVVKEDAKQKRPVRKDQKNEKDNRRAAGGKRQN